MLRAIVVPILLAALASSAVAQVRPIDLSGVRQSAGLLFFGEKGPLGSFRIEHGAPAWRDDYRAMVTAAEPATLRLGAGAWTTLDVGVPLAFGDVTVPVGHYYVGLRREGAGRFALLAFDSDRLRRAGLLPGRGEPGEPAAAIPLALADGAGSADALTIRVESGEPAPAGFRLSIEWGPFRLEARGAASLATGRKAAFDAAIADMIALIDAERYRKLIETYAEPDALASKDFDVDEIAASFAERKAAQLRAALVLVQAQQPAVDDDQSEVVVEHEDLPRDRIRFRWVDGRWRLCNS